MLIYNTITINVDLYNNSIREEQRQQQQNLSK